MDKTEAKEEVVPTSAPPETKEEEENVVPTVPDPPHDYDKEKYKKVVELINEHRAQNSPRIVVDEARQVELPLNLMDDSVLHEVIARRKTDLAVAIIDALTPNEDDMFRHKNYYGDTPLHIASEKGDRTVAKALLDKDTRLARLRNRKGETPLHKALQFCHPDLFNLIIEAGGPDMAHDRTDDGFTILHYAIMRKQTREALDIATKFPELILVRNADGATPLQMMGVVYFTKPQKKKNGISGRALKGIMPPKRGTWWWSLPVISNLLKRIDKEREEMSNYKMSMELLELLVQPQGFEFYIRGFTSQRSIESHTPIHSLVRTNSGALFAGKDTDRLDKVPEVNHRTRWEESPLTTGVKLGLDDFVIKILQVRPELATYLDYDGTNVLQAAVKYGRKRVVKSIEKNTRLPPWLFTDLESDTNNTLLHIAASNKISSDEANPLRLTVELQWFEMLGKIVPKNLWDYRNRRRMTAGELFHETHKGTLKDCRENLRQMGTTLFTGLMALVLYSGLYIINKNNWESSRPAYKIFGHAYLVGVSFALTSAAIFILLAMSPFKLQDFQRKVPLYYVMAFFMMLICVTALCVAFACIVYLQVYTNADKATMLLELLLLPLLCALGKFFLTGRRY